MEEIGFDKSDIDKIWKLILTILELGNLEFDDKRHQNNESNPCEIKNKSDLPKISKILNLSVDAL
jgi:myosin heavy subunit